LCDKWAINFKIKTFINLRLKHLLKEDLRLRKLNITIPKNIFEIMNFSYNDILNKLNIIMTNDNEFSWNNFGKSRYWNLDFKNKPYNFIYSTFNDNDFKSLFNIENINVFKNTDINFSNKSIIKPYNNLLKFLYKRKNNKLSRKDLSEKINISYYELYNKIITKNIKKYGIFISRNVKLENLNINDVLIDEISNVLSIANKESKAAKFEEFAKNKIFKQNNKICNKCKNIKKNNQFSLTKNGYRNKLCNSCKDESKLNSQKYRKEYSKQYCDKTKVKNKICNVCKNYLSIDKFIGKYSIKKKFIYYSRTCCKCINLPKNDFKSAWSRDIRVYLKNLKYATNNVKNGLVILGYTIEELKEHIEKQFEPWMNWGNWGVYKPKLWNDNDKSTWVWHIDHIVPHSEFIYNNINDNDFKNAWNLNNLRPLNAKQNVLDGCARKRHKKYNKKISK